jgi:PKD repeat protein
MRAHPRLATSAVPPEEEEMTARARALVIVSLVLAGCENNNRPNLPPVATVTVSPVGTAIARATRVNFHAAGVDPDSDIVTYRWDFGDQSQATGPDVTHVFPTVGTFTVNLTVGDGKDTTVIPSKVTVDNLVGSWDIAQGSGLRGEIAFGFDNTTPALPGTAFFDRGFSSTLDGRSQASDPYRIVLGYRDPRSTCDMTFSGQASLDLRTINGTSSCTGCTACEGRTLSILLVKRP